MVRSFRFFFNDFLEADSRCSKAMPKDVNEKPDGTQMEERLPCGWPFLGRLLLIVFFVLFESASDFSKDPCVELWIKENGLFNTVHYEREKRFNNCNHSSGFSN